MPPFENNREGKVLAEACRRLGLHPFPIPMLRNSVPYNGRPACVLSSAPSPLASSSEPAMVPLICAGGIGSDVELAEALRLGYAGVQMGTRFIATTECTSAEPYKQAIVDADEDDIVLTERITGVPVSVIKTPYIERMGLKAGLFERWMLRGRKRKHWMRTIYALRSLWQLKSASLDETGRKDYWQAGKSVGGVAAIESAGDVVQRFAQSALDSSSVIGTAARPVSTGAAAQSLDSDSESTDVTA